jgi:hypothetical protein
MLKAIGYAPDALFRPREAPAMDDPAVYPGRAAGANPVQEFKASLPFHGSMPKAPENGDTDSGMYW